MVVYQSGVTPRPEPPFVALMRRNLGAAVIELYFPDELDGLRYVLESADDEDVAEGMGFYPGVDDADDVPSDEDEGDGVTLKDDVRGGAPSASAAASSALASSAESHVHSTVSASTFTSSSSSAASVAKPVVVAKPAAKPAAKPVAKPGASAVAASTPAVKRSPSMLMASVNHIARYRQLLFELPFVSLLLSKRTVFHLALYAGVIALFRRCENYLLLPVASQ
jgi:hypothetical protein